MLYPVDSHGHGEDFAVNPWLGGTVSTSEPAQDDNLTGWGYVALPAPLVRGLLITTMEATIPEVERAALYRSQRSIQSGGSGKSIGHESEQVVHFSHRYPAAALSCPSAMGRARLCCLGLDRRPID